MIPSLLNINTNIASGTMYLTKKYQTLKKSRLRHQAAFLLHKRPLSQAGFHPTPV